jgi:hypothetical protein
MADMSERNIQLLVKEKILPRASRGQYNLFFAGKAYIKYLKDRLGGKITDPAEGDLKGRKLKAETEEREAKAALRRIELEEEQGKLFRKEEVIRQWSARLIEFKAAMLELPKQVAFRFADPDVRMHIEEEVSTAVAEILSRYSRNGICPVGDGDDAQDPSASQADDGQ